MSARVVGRPHRSRRLIERETIRVRGRYADFTVERFLGFIRGHHRWLLVCRCGRRVVRTAAIIQRAIKPHYVTECRHCRRRARSAHSPSQPWGFLLEEPWQPGEDEGTRSFDTEEFDVPGVHPRTLKFRGWLREWESYVAA